MSLIDRARELHKQIEANAASMDDEQASQFVELFPEWSGDSSSYTTGDRVRYGGALYRELQDHTSQVTWNSDDAPSLLAAVLPGQDGTEIGDWVQPDSTNPYSKGDGVQFEGKIYESLIDGNVWSPAAYPSGWQEVV